MLIHDRIQRYEGASTLYGPHTLAAYINVTLSWIQSLGSSSSKPSPYPPRGPEPPDNSNRSLSFIPQVIRDAPPFFKNFGDVLEDVKPSRLYRKGEVVRVKFVGANPRNNLRLGESYAVVEKFEPREGWKIVRDDGDWHLVFRWRRVSEVLATSEVTVEWETVDPWVVNGVYRIRYFGDAKSFGGTVTSFEGVSGGFTVVG